MVTERRETSAIPRVTRHGPPAGPPSRGPASASRPRYRARGASTPASRTRRRTSSGRSSPRASAAPCRADIAACWSAGRKRRGPAWASSGWRVPGSHAERRAYWDRLFAERSARQARVGTWAFTGNFLSLEVTDTDLNLLPIVHRGPCAPCHVPPPRRRRSLASISTVRVPTNKNQSIPNRFCLAEAFRKASNESRCSIGRTASYPLSRTDELEVQVLTSASRRKNKEESPSWLRRF